MTRTPPPAAPYTIWMDAISLSAWMNVRPTRGKYLAAASAISLAGVMG